MKKCRFCAEEILEEAIICKHCGRDQNSLTTAEITEKIDNEIQPYRFAGYRIAERTENRVVLTKSPSFELYDWIILLLAVCIFWPLALVWAMVYFSSSAKRAFIQVLTNGEIHVSGHTLEAFERANRRRRFENLVVLGTIAALILIVGLTLFIAKRLYE